MQAGGAEERVAGALEGRSSAGRCQPPPPLGVAPHLRQPLLHTNLPRPFHTPSAARELKAGAPAAEVATARRQPTTTVRCRRLLPLQAALELPPPNLPTLRRPALPCPPALPSMPKAHTPAVSVTPLAALSASRRLLLRLAARRQRPPPRPAVPPLPE